NAFMKYTLVNALGPGKEAPGERILNFLGKGVSASLSAAFPFQTAPLPPLAPNRHRGSGHPLAPATPPDMRVRIRRFSAGELESVHQPGKTKRVEGSNRKGGVQGG